VKEMSADIKTQPGSADDQVITFEELPELNPDGSNKGNNAGQVGEQIDAAGAKGPGYGCPQGQKFDKDAKKCVPIKKGGDGTEGRAQEYKCKVGEVWDETAGKCVPVSQAAASCTCAPGEVFDDKKGKCVPVKEALSARDAEILSLGDKVKNLSDALGIVQDALRAKNIEAEVDTQVQAGHIAPSQRGKVISFLQGLPDDKRPDLIGIFARQKFPLATETSAQESVKPADEAADEKITDEKRKELKSKFGINDLIKEHGVKN
jgi:hypothetical protein